MFGIKAWLNWAAGAAYESALHLGYTRAEARTMTGYSGKGSTHGFWKAVGAVAGSAVRGAFDLLKPEVWVTDVYATVMGNTYGKARAMIDVTKKLVSAFGNKSGRWRAVGEFLITLPFPNYGYYGGRNWGRSQFPDGVPGPVNFLDDVNYWHDGNQPEWGWIRRAWDPNAKGMGIGLGGQAFRLIGTVGFGLWGALGGG